MDKRDLEVSREMARSLRKIFEENPEKRRYRFEHLVLSALWILILNAVAKQPRYDMRSLVWNWRQEVLYFSDALGNQSESAPEYRRENTFPEPNDD